MTKSEAQKLISQYGSQTRAAKAKGCSVKTIARALKKADDNGVEPSAGFAIGEANVYIQQPQDRIKGLLYGLKKNMYYPIKEIAKDWCVSPETATKHAKRFDCLRYVESPINPGIYIKAVMHPDTAAKYGG